MKMKSIKEKKELKGKKYRYTKLLSYIVSKYAGILVSTDLASRRSNNINIPIHTPTGS
jgi:hypothetical protein